MSLSFLLSPLLSLCVSKNTASPDLKKTLHITSSSSTKSPQMELKIKYPANECFFPSLSFTFFVSNVKNTENSDRETRLLITLIHILKRLQNAT